MRRDKLLSDARQSFSRTHVNVGFLTWSRHRLQRSHRISSDNRHLQHNPNAADGPEGLKAYISFLREKFPDAHSEVIRVFADGDYVIQHVQSVPTPGSRGNAIVNIYKLENGKIVEHWDVIQPVPEKSANDNTMF